MLSRALMQAVKKPVSGPKPSTIFAARWFRYVTFFNVSDWSEIRRSPELSCGLTEINPYCGLQISSDDRFYITNGSAGTGVYSMVDDSQLFFYANTTPCQPAISHAGDRIAFELGTKNVAIYETTTWTQVGECIPGPTVKGKAVLSWSNDDSKLAHMDSDANVMIFETVGYTVYSAQIALLKSAGGSIRFSPDDTQLAVGLPATEPAVVNVMTVQPTLVPGDVFTDDMQDRDCIGLAYSPDSLYAANANRPAGNIESWDFNTWVQNNITTSSTTQDVGLIEFSNDYSLLAASTVTGAGVYVWIFNADLTPHSGPVPPGTVLGVAWNHPT